MSCLPTHNGIRYNSIQELKNSNNLLLKEEILKLLKNDLSKLKSPDPLSGDLNNIWQTNENQLKSKYPGITYEGFVSLTDKERENLISCL